MNIDRIRGYFNTASTVEHYVRAVANIGLWNSEKTLFNKYLGKSYVLLDLGCGAGRVSIGLWKLGFENVQGADLAEQMALQASEIALCLGCPICFEQQDATRLSYSDATFDGVVFAFNGLMQIPGRAMRQQALREIARVLRRGGRFIFSTLDREDALYSKVFDDETDYEHDLSRNEGLLDYGDRHFETEHGTTFMHVPLCAEVTADLEAAGFEVLESAMRSELAKESPAVLDFSEDCRMWVAAIK